MNDDLDWRRDFDERELKEVSFSQVYATGFAHGTAGHNRLMLIAKMAEQLDRYESLLQFAYDAMSAKVDKSE